MEIKVVTKKSEDVKIGDYFYRRPDSNQIVQAIEKSSADIDGDFIMLVKNCGANRPMPLYKGGDYHMTMFKGDEWRVIERC